MDQREQETEPQRKDIEDVKEPLVLRVESQQLYLDREHPALAGENYVAAQRICRDWLIEQTGIHIAVTRDNLLAGQGGGELNDQFLKTFHAARSGDVLWAYEPYYLCGGGGTTHGSPWKYDSNVPLMLIGHGISNGRYERRVTPGMLAPTAAKLLGVEPPVTCVEPALHEIFAK